MPLIAFLTFYLDSRETEVVPSSSLLYSLNTSESLLSVSLLNGNFKSLHIFKIGSALTFILSRV